MKQHAAHLRRLQNLNTLLASAVNSAPEIAANLRAAIHHARHLRADEALPLQTTESISRFVGIYRYHHPDQAISWCDLQDHAKDPLFVRALLLTALRELAGYRNSILLITGLSESIRPPGKRWSTKRRRAYQTAIHHILALVAHLLPTDARIKVIAV